MQRAAGAGARRLIDHVVGQNAGTRAVQALANLAEDTLTDNKQPVDSRIKNKMKEMLDKFFGTNLSEKDQRFVKEISWIS